MPEANWRARRASWIAICILAATCAAAVSSRPAAAAEYIDAGLSDVKPADRAVVAHPQPVQLLFQFKTRGAPNGRATKFLKDKVLDVVKKSGFFTDVGDAPTPNGAVLSIVIDNVVQPGETGAAEAKGMVTGATFFLVGNTVRDSYLCTVSYTPGPGAAIITRTASHALYTQVGMTAPAPQNAVKIGRLKDALDIMVRQIVDNPLNAVASDPGFQQASASTTVAATPAPAPPAETPTPAASTPATSAAEPAPGPAPSAAQTPPPAAAAAATAAPTGPAQ